MIKFYSWSDLKNLVKQQVPDSKKDKSKDIIKWQTDSSRDNDFPQQLIQNVYNSPVGSACLKIWAEFVQGNGLLDKKAGKTIINQKTKLTLDDLHSLLSVDVSLMEGFSFIQRYTTEGKKADVLHLPFEETRLGINDNETGDIERIYHNPYYGIPRVFKDINTKWFYAYNPEPKFVMTQIKQHNKEFVNKDDIVDPPYPGQAFWFSIEKPLARVYPQAFYYSAIDSFIVDGEIASFHERNIKNNFMASVLINIHGDPSAPAGRQDDTDATIDKTLDQGETVGEEMNRQMKEFVNEKGAPIFNWFLKDEEKATFETFPTNSHDNEYLNLQTSTTDHIAIGTGTPRILVGIGTAGKLGDTQEVLNAISLMQGKTQSMRNILTRCYETKFNFVTDGTIKKINPFDIIPDQIWQSLTTEEQRKFIEKNFDIELIGNTPATPQELKINSNVS